MLFITSQQRNKNNYTKDKKILIKIIIGLFNIKYIQINFLHPSDNNAIGDELLRKIINVIRKNMFYTFIGNI